MTKSDNQLSQIHPTSGVLLIAPDEPTKQTASGIYLPDNASGDKPQTGTVLAAGDDTKEAKAPAKKNDKVIYKKWGGNEVKIEGREYLFVKFEDILAVLN